MHIRFFLTVFSLILALALPMDSQAQIPEKVEKLPDTSKSLEELSRERPKESFTAQETDGLTIAMVFYKITRQTPDFEAWARTMPEYDNAPDHAQSDVLNEISGRLEEQFNLISINEPIHIEKYVTLKQYDAESGGFFINDFKEDTFFTDSFNNQNYAIIPSDLMDYQWISVQPEQQAEIQDHMTDKQQIFMRLSLSPERGDARGPVRLSNEKENWLLSAKILDIEFWSPTDQTLIWRSNEDFHSRKNQLLNLYQ